MSGSLPELPHDPTLDVQTEAVIEHVQGRLLLVLPYQLPATASRGRRYRVGRGREHAIRVLVRLGDRTACRPVGAVGEGDRFTVTVRALARHRPRRIPDDLSAALQHAGLGLDGFPDAHVQQLVLMVTEARDPAIRAERVCAAVNAVRQAR